MKKKHKKGTHIEGSGCFLDTGTWSHVFHNYHLVVAESPGCNDRVIILNCMHYAIKELEVLHEYSLLCFSVWCDSCSEIEVPTEKNFYYIKFYGICDNNSVWLCTI